MKRQSINFVLSAVSEIIVAISVVIGAIGALLFGLGLNVGHPVNQAELYFGIILICIALFGALIVSAVEGIRKQTIQYP
jgi:hypothetical protein